MVCLFSYSQPLRIEIIQNMSYVYQMYVKHDKNQKLIYFCSVSKPVKPTNALKTLDFVAAIPLETFR